jgi:hypothetical protein
MGQMTFLYHAIFILPEQVRASLNGLHGEQKTMSRMFMLVMIRATHQVENFLNRGLNTWDLITYHQNRAYPGG